jgi:hypothetical protein
VERQYSVNLQPERAAMADAANALAALAQPKEGEPHRPSREEIEEALREAFLAGADQDHATGALANIYARNTVDALFHGEKALSRGDGWVLVPKEPDEVAMKRAADLLGYKTSWVRAAYRGVIDEIAPIQAAPPVPEGEE